MSFGCGVGDIALLVGFGAKVVAALKNDGGSQMEYQFAEHQCQSFLQTMEEIKQLDLSNVPESFRNRIEEHSSNVKKFVQDFKSTIDRYEKSMGENSARGWLTSAPRKVQWAFEAADDLAKFRQSLAAQLDLVKITIQTSILAIVSSHADSRQQLDNPVRSQALVRRVQQSGQGQSYLNWYTQSPKSLEFYEKVDDIAALVYDRLFSRPALPFAGQGRVHTLVDNVTSDGLQTRLDSNSSGYLVLANRHTEDADPSNTPDNLDGNAKAHPRTTDQGTLADDINEYLKSLHLDELSNEEAGQLDIINSPQRLLTNGAEEMLLTAQSHANSAKVNIQPERPKRRAHQKKTSSGFGRIDPLSGISLAANILSFVGLSAKLSFDIMSAYRSVGGAPHELVMLSEGIMEFSGLMQSASEVVRSSMPTGQLQELGLRVVRRSQGLLDEVKHILERYHLKPGRRAAAAMLSMVRWQSTRTQVFEMMKQIESLKITLSVMLQIHQIQLTERNLITTEVATQYLHVQALVGSRSQVVRNTSK